jgi:hypothetical protein
VPWWDGDTGFQTEWDDWDPEQPDIVPGDYVDAWISTGYTATVRIGTINGEVNTATNSISGTVLVAWLSDTLDVSCGPYIENGVWKYSTAEPDGSAPYFCQWDPGSEWEMEPGQNVAVSYSQPDAHRVTNVFLVPYPYHVFLPVTMRGD